MYKFVFRWLLGAQGACTVPPTMAVTTFTLYMRQQLQAFRMPGDGSDEALVAGKVKAIVDLICESVRGAGPALTASRCRTSTLCIPAGLALVGRFPCDGIGVTKLDVLRFSFYVRGYRRGEGGGGQPYSQRSAQRQEVNKA